MSSHQISLIHTANNVYSVSSLNYLNLQNLNMFKLGFLFENFCYILVEKEDNMGVFLEKLTKTTCII